MNIINRITGKTLFTARILAIGVVAALMLMGTAMGEVSRTGLVAEYHFDGDAKDSSGNGNDGKISGATFVNGISGKALSFDGVDDGVIIDDSTSLNIEISSFSIGAWIRYTQVHSGATIPAGQIAHHSDGSKWISLSVDPGIGPGQAYFGTSNGRLSYDVFSSNKLNDGEWHYVVAVQDVPAGVKLYVDGVLQGTAPGYYTNAIVGSWSIGKNSYYPAQYFNGLIDEVRIYNRALTADEVKTNYEAVTATTQTSLTGDRYYVKSIVSSNSYWKNLNNIVGTPDNNYATSSNPSHTMPQVVLDFGTALTSGKIRIRLNDPYGSLTELAVDVSDDISKEFIPVGRHIAGISSGGIGDVEVTFPKMTFRYVKIYQSQTSPGQEDSIDSVEVVVDEASATTGGLVAWYKFDEAAGTVLRDDSGNGNHGTIYGATWTQGISGNALHFDGISNYVEIPESPSLNPAQTTVIVWFKPEQRTEPINTRQFVISKGAVRNKLYPYEIDLIKNSPRYQDNMILFSYAVGEGNNPQDGGIASSGVIAEVGKWYHVAGTFDGTAGKVYVDGELKGSTSIPTGIIYKNGLNLQIGRGYNWGGYECCFKGVIDDVRIYNRALSASEIQTEYNAFSPTTTPSPTTPVPTTYAPQTTTPSTQPATSSMKQPLLTISQTSLKEEPEVGEEVLITVTVMNSGDSTAKNIRLTEQIPSSIAVSFVDGANKPGNLVTWEGELKPNRAHTITHTVKILEEKGRAIPVIIKYEDEEGNPKETSTTVYVDAKPHATAAPTPVWTKEEPRDVNVKLPGFEAPLVLIGFVAVILLARRR